MRIHRMLAAALAAALAALASCYQPIYDPAVSSAALFYQRIGAPLRVLGPVQYSGGSGADLEFQPTRGGDPQDGFLVERSGTSLRSAFLWNNAGTWQLTGEGSQPSPLGRHAIARSAIPDGVNPRLLLQADQGSVYYRIFNRGPSQVTSGSPLAIGGATRLLALGASMTSVDDEDRVAVLYKAGALTQFATINLTGGSAVPSIGSVNLPVMSPTTIEGLGRTFDLEGANSIYFSPPGGAAGYYWSTGTTSIMPTILPGLAAPISGVLRDGTLLAQDEIMLSAYKNDGTRYYSVPAGDVRFAHETHWVGPPAGNYAIFTQVIHTPSLNGGELRVAIWRIPAAAVKNLGN